MISTEYAIHLLEAQDSPVISTGNMWMVGAHHSSTRLKLDVGTMTVVLDGADGTYLVNVTHLGENAFKRDTYMRLTIADPLFKDHFSEAVTKQEITLKDIIYLLRHSVIDKERVYQNDIQVK